MPKDNELRALNCPNCSAPLEFPGAQAAVRCKFCGSVIERSDDAPTPEDEAHSLSIHVVNGRIEVDRPRQGGSTAKRFTIKMQGSQPLVIEGGAWAATREATPPAAPSARRPAASSRGGCAVAALVLIIVLATVVPLAAAFLDMAQVSQVLRSVFSGDLGQALTAAPALGTRILVGASAALVPSPADAPPDIIALATTYPADGSDSQQRLVALSGVQPALLWQSAPLEKDTYDAPILADREHVYTVSGARLLALSRADGTLAWEASLADKVVSNLCRACVRLLGDRLFALSTDGTLEAFEAGTGQSAWRFTAVQDSPRGLYLLDGRPAFMDEDDNSDGVLRVFDPSTGEMQTVQPTCMREGASFADHPRWTTPLVLSPDEADVYLAFGSAPVCIQRWSADALTQAWEAQLPAGYSASGDTPTLVTEEALYLVFGQELIRVDAAGGEVSTLVSNADYQLVPIVAQEDMLIAAAVRQRGSTRFELWALDGETGEARWQFDLGEDPPLWDGPYGNTSIIDEAKPVWTWRATPDGLQLIRFKRAEDDVSHAILVETLDWATGASGGQRETRLGIETIILSAPTLVGWTRDTLWMSIEREMLGFDAASGQITYRWP